MFRPFRCVPLVIVAVSMMLANTPAARASGLPFTAALAHGGGGSANLTVALTPDGECKSTLVLLPAGTQQVKIVAVEASRETETCVLPADAVQVGSIMSLRGMPVVPVTYALGDCPQSVSIQLASEGAQASDIPGPWSGWPLGFDRSSSPTHQGGYLIITVDAFIPALEPLITWKIAAGYDIEVRTTSEIGTSREEILAFIQEAYDTWPDPPLYLLLVGDVEDVPTWDIDGNVSDHPYACVDGEDFLPDLLAGRLSAQSPAEVEVQVAKTVAYESAPDLAGGDPWFSRALLVAGDSGSSTPRALSDWAGDELLAADYAEITEVYYPPIWNGVPFITAAVDQGVSLVNYRGWAYGDIGWEPPRFTVDDIPALQNGGKLPFVWSIVCHTGNFGNPSIDCFGEAWLKAGTPTEPKGAVGFIGTGEHWVHSRWNDRLDIELMSAVCHHGARRFGEILALAKVALIPQFPTEIEMWDSYGGLIEESVEYYAHIYNLLGDPSLTLWTVPPRPIQITGPGTLPAAANFTEILVTEDDGVTPVPGARVCLVQDGLRVGYAVTGEDGWAVPALTLHSLGPILVTVTGEALHPRQEILAIIEPDMALTCIGATVTAGALLPGTSVTLALEVENTGTTTISGAAAKIVMPPGIPPAPQKVALPTLEPGDPGTALSDITVALAADLENERRLCFVLTPTIPGMGMLAPSEACLAVQAPDIKCVDPSVVIDLSPGQSGPLVLTLANSGAVAAGLITAQLTALTPGIVTLLDSVATFPEILPGETGENPNDPFSVQITHAAAIGTVIPMCMEIEHAGGPRGTVAFNLIVGAAQACDPIGPDAYGYYCYDNHDLNDPAQAPVYDWVECSPLYGGAGIPLTEIENNTQGQVVALPFPFTYYGTEYDSVLVSDNGWISFDTAFWYDVRNWRMPDRWGGPCQVGVFWDNLDPTIPDSDGIYAWHDAGNDRFIIEWSHLQNWQATANSWQTFQVILHDPAATPTPTGDGVLLFQYRQIVNDDWERMYATVGIEDQSQDVGILYTYGNEYVLGAAPLAPELAVLFTTEPPRFERDRADLPPTLHSAGPFLRMARGSVTTGPCQIQYGSGGRPLIEFAIYNAMGRRVIDLKPSAGSGSIVWDGRDAQDHAVAAGTYWVRLRAAGEEHTAKLLRLR